MTKREAQQRANLYENMARLGFSRQETDSLRRIEMTLQKWGEHECGDSNDKFSSGIERDEETGKPYWVVRWHNENKARKTPAADREKGALARLKRIMASRPHLTAYHQGDCRGCNLYILRPEDLLPGHDINSIYTRGLAVC